VKSLVDPCLNLPPNKELPRNESGHRGHHPHIHHLGGAGRGDASAGHVHLDRDRIRRRGGELMERARTLEHHHHTFAHRLEELGIHSPCESLAALVVISVSFSLARLIGEFPITGGALDLIL
jgi:hypothetical protein